MLAEDILYALNPWWEGGAAPSGFRREKYLGEIDFSQRQITLIQGSRRIGKSTLLMQIGNTLAASGIAPQRILFLPLDHALLGDRSIFSILKQFRTLHSHPLSAELFLLLDEVQENPHWITELKTIYDTENVHFYCTGSHTAQLDSEGSKLTGRSRLVYLHPVEYSEYLAMRNIRISRAESYLHVNEVKRYLQTGGYPEMVFGADKNYLEKLVKDIIERDLRTRYRLKKHYLLEDLFELIVQSTGTPLSFQKTANILGTTDDTVKEYVYLFRKCFLVNNLPKWTWSVNERIYNPEKLYPVDSGMIGIHGHSPDFGKCAELAVYNSLAKMRRSGYYKINGLEVDFAFGNISGVTLVESKYRDDISLDHRRLNAVKKAIDRDTTIQQAWIITNSLEKTEEWKNILCCFVPLWKWLLEVSPELE